MGPQTQIVYVAVMGFLHLSSQIFFFLLVHEGQDWGGNKCAKWKHGKKSTFIWDHSFILVLIKNIIFITRDSTISIITKFKFFCTELYLFLTRAILLEISEFLLPSIHFLCYSNNAYVLFLLAVLYHLLLVPSFFPSISFILSFFSAPWLSITPTI